MSTFVTDDPIHPCLCAEIIISHLVISYHITFLAGMHSLHSIITPHNFNYFPLNLFALFVLRNQFTHNPFRSPESDDEDPGLVQRVNNPAFEDQHLHRCAFTRSFIGVV